MRITATTFRDLREALLCAGIAPRHVRAYMRELEEHLADLTERECAAGYDAETAAIRARARLGDDAALTAAMLDQPGMRSISARAPWLVFGLAPPFFVLVATLLIVIPPSLYFLQPFIRRGGAPLADMPHWYYGLAELIMFCGNVLVGPLAASLFILLAMRQRLRSVWPIIGLLAIAFFAAIFTYSIDFPDNGKLGHFAIEAWAFHNNPLPYYAQTWLILLRFGVTLLAAACVYWFFRKPVADPRAD